MVLLPFRENLPPELLELHQWILWFEERRGDKLDKIPSAPWKTGHWKQASATDPQNWTDFDTAIEWAKKRDGYGVGFCFRPEGGIVGIDLDGCIDETGNVSKKAQRIIERANSYTELSPSGRGIHIIVKGILPAAITKNDGVEAYDRDRFFTVSGRRLISAPCAVNEAQDLLDELYEKYGRKIAPLFVTPEEKKMSILRVAKTEGLRRRGNQLQGSHPTHGSTTGMNFSINPEKNCWYCYRHQVGGGPVSLVAIQEGIITCEELAAGKLSGERLKKALALARGMGLELEEEQREGGITDKQITDTIMSKYLFYCDRHDESTTLYIWEGNGWSNGVAEGIILHELSEIFKNEEDRAKMVLERTVNFIKGQAMNLDLKPKPPHVIPFRNGLYDAKTGELKPHDPGLFYTNVIPHNYDPVADCPRWKQWLKEVVKEEDIPFLQEWLGYLLYDDYPEPGFLILVGSGQNGKTVFMDILLKLLGERNVTSVSIHDIAEGPYAMAELHRKLAVLCDEISSRAVRNTGPIKMISSGSWVEARQIYGKHFSFKNYAKPIFSSNEPPEFRDDSDAIKYRLKAVEFPYVFRKNPDRERGERQARDRKELEAELEAEIPGIINWALEGLKRLMTKNFTFTDSRSTEETWAFYRRKSNPVACFVEECLEATDDPADVLTRDEMYGAFTTWLKDRKVNLNVSRDKFFKAMKALGIEATQSREYDRKRVYIGYKCHNVTYVQPPLLAEKAKNNEMAQQVKIENFGKQGEFQQCDNVTPKVDNVTMSHPLIKVKVLVDIPYVIIGVDGKTYGPFSTGDVVEIPRENALLLAHGGLVEILDQEDR